MKNSDRFFRALALLSLAPALALPISNPDLFWHLSAARRMRETGAIPTADWLSATRAGVPWTNFEWISQLVFDALHRGGGFFALWAFKAALMAASAWILMRTLRLYAAPAAARYAALALWGAASLTRSDIRPELFSLLGFGLVFLFLESRRLGSKAPGPGWLVLLFAAWANVHPGFTYGLALVGLYAAGEAIESAEPGRRPPGPSFWAYPAAAGFGCLLQLHLVANTAVLWRHWRDMGRITVHLAEWQAISLLDPWHWPYWFALLAGGGAALLLLARGRAPLGPIAAFLFFGFTASRHMRMSAYFVSCGVPLLVYFLSEAGALRDESARRRPAVALLIAFTCFSFVCSSRYGFGRKIFNARHVPADAADFLERSAPMLPQRVLYNPWAWGGYLGWRLYPDYLVFQDGRYIFHALLPETQDAAGTPADWSRFLDRRRIDLALLERALWEPHPDFMPRADWALVYRDEKALLFARRRTVPARWIAALEPR